MTIDASANRCSTSTGAHMQHEKTAGDAHTQNLRDTTALLRQTIHARLHANEIDRIRIAELEAQIIARESANAARATLFAPATAAGVQTRSRHRKDARELIQVSAVAPGAIPGPASLPGVRT